MSTNAPKTPLEAKEEMTVVLPSSTQQSNEAMKNKERLLFRKRCTC